MLWRPLAASMSTASRRTSTRAVELVVSGVHAGRGEAQSGAGREHGHRGGPRRDLLRLGDGVPFEVGDDQGRHRELEEQVADGRVDAGASRLASGDGVVEVAHPQVRPRGRAEEPPGQRPTPIGGAGVAERIAGLELDGREQARVQRCSQAAVGWARRRRRAEVAGERGSRLEVARPCSRRGQHRQHRRILSRRAVGDGALRDPDGVGRRRVEGVDHRAQDHPMAR